MDVFFAADQEQRVHRLRPCGQVHQPDGRLPALRRGEERLRHDQGLLHRPQEEGAHPAQVPPHPHQEEGAGEDQAQVHRHQLQVRPRTLPDAAGQDGLHGTAQEGQGEGRGRRQRRGLRLDELARMNFSQICILVLPVRQRRFTNKKILKIYTHFSKFFM